jgi:chemotaxis protein CheD
MKHIVNVADVAVSNQPDDTIITYALGPCLGVAISDARAGVGGLVHCQLPTASMDQRRAAENPSLFVDSGVLLLLEQLCDLGGTIPQMRIVVAGGAQVLNDLNSFNIARRNYVVLRKLLAKNALSIHAEDVGGDLPRTMSLAVGTGAVVIQSQGRESLLAEPLHFLNSVASVSSLGGVAG